MKFILPEEIDHHSAKEIVKILDRMIEQDGVRELNLDLSKTKFMDSSGVGMIIGRYKKLELFNGKITVSNCSNRIEKIMQASGLHRIIEIKKSNKDNVTIDERKVDC